ncbi:MAG: SDR family NAD(P)-dependent oxidoreductase [Bryobacteraceae bacterium]|nr:SDR family NAD(P)-dependent oxidoreductase [Bryobacteraceae bacterium]
MVDRMDVGGKVVLITGASEGIGAACARAFGAKGALLSLTARRQDKLREVAGTEVLITPGDITEDSTQRAVIQGTVARFGRLDILINNAGAGLYGRSWDTPVEEARRMFELNFFAPLGLIQHAVPVMRRQRTGCIVNVASIAGKVSLPWLTLYSASKYALGAMTDGMRMELRREGIHTITVCPGYVSTRFQQNIMGGDVPSSVREGKWFRITAEQCAAAIVRGVERETRTVVTPASGWAFVIMERLFPSLVDRQLERILFRSSS